MNNYFEVFFFDILKIFAILIPVLIAVALIVWVDRRVWGAVQLRKGPNVVGPFGLLQTAADALKYIFKEIVVPVGANKIIFFIAPVVTMSLALAAWS
ncbi:MAG: NADH-quinone oxidoreductase subunit H, partial [Candidatus Fonsibacter sp.]